jgi:hypothetical protein
MESVYHSEMQLDSTHLYSVTTQEILRFKDDICLEPHIVRGISLFS